MENERIALSLSHMGENEQKWNVIGAGSVVTRDIPDHVVAYGSPCKVVRENKI